MKMSILDFSSNGRVCLERMKHQIRSRFVAVEEPKTYVTLYLDPCTVPYVNQIIPQTLKEGTLQLFTEMVTHVLKVTTPPAESINHMATASIDTNESTGNSGTEADIEMDNDFVLETSAGDYSLGPDAHGGKNPCVVVNSWIDHSHQNIDWGQFLRRSREDSKMKAFEDQTQTSQKQPSYNNLLNRLQYCDPMI